MVQQRAEENAKNGYSKPGATAKRALVSIAAGLSRKSSSKRIVLSRAAPTGGITSSPVAARATSTAGRPPQLTSTERGTYKDSHGSPIWVTDLVKRIFGRIDMDLASSREDNKRIGSRGFYSKSNPCPAVLKHITGEVLYTNPPGPSEHVVRFWNTWCRGIGDGAEGAFLFFSADHIRLVTEHPDIPLHVLIPHKRLKFHGNKTQCSWVSALVSTKPPKLETDWLLGHWLIWEPHR